MHLNNTHLHYTDVHLHEYNSLQQPPVFTISNCKLTQLYFSLFKNTFVLPFSQMHIRRQYMSDYSYVHLNIHLTTAHLRSQFCSFLQYMKSPFQYLCVQMSSTFYCRDQYMDKLTSCITFEEHFKPLV